MKTVRTTARIATLMGMTALATIFAPVAAPAATAARQGFAIPAGALGPALNQFGRSASVAISYDAALVAGKATAGVGGTHGAAQALDILLRGTALRASPDGAGGFVVSTAPAARQDNRPRRVLAARPAIATADEAEEILVTGGRFQNSLINRLPTDPRELPFSLDIIDSAVMAERGFFNPFDILETVPNVVRRQTQNLPGGGTYFVRGLQGSVLTNNRPESDSRGAGRREMSFIDRIEIVKGPASILQGPVIPGGVINQVTKSPQDTDFVDLTGRVGSYGTWRAEIDANTASLFGGDILSARLTAAYEDLGSPQKPEHTETFAVRPVVEAHFSDRTRAQFSVAYTRRDSVPGSRFAVNADGTVPDTIRPSSYFGVASKQRGEDTYFDAEFQHEFLDNLKLVVRGSHQDANFAYQTSQGAYNYTGSGRGFEPGDSNAYVYYSRGSRDQDVTYGDVQLVGNFNAFGQRQDWVIGGSYKREKTTSLWGFGGVLGVVDINDIASATYLTPDFSIPVTPFFTNQDRLHSIYAETNIRPSDRLTIVAGARYDAYRQESLRGGNTTVNKYDDVTVRAGASYALASGLNAYVSYAESFIPQSGTTRSGDPVKPETATNYEIGLKGSLLDGRLRLTAAAFALTRQNVATADPANVPGQPAYVVATGEQEHNGFEVSVNADLTSALRVDASYGYVDAKITRTNDNTQGNPVALVPHHTFSVHGSYTVEQGALAGLRFGVGARGISNRPAPRYKLTYGGYTLVDASLFYPLSDQFSVQLNIHNLLDKRYRDNIGFDTGNPAGGHRFGNPRTAYLTLRATL
ncbi:TonB-dependent siderophore receptor [Sphingomonas flavalba]|uniref:TonB-dependent siderophore receptor n=1 Tax=Sphingomonas flavalba TaxID=2559804 RepID=UPI0039E1599C